MDDDIKMIGNLRKLEKLNLSRTRITDNALQYICGLKELVCRNCTGLTTSGLKKFIKFSPKLELLDIRGCRYTTKFHIETSEVTLINRSNNVVLRILE